MITIGLCPAFFHSTGSAAATSAKPPALAKGVKYATTPNEVENNPSNTYPNTITVDAVNSNNPNNSDTSAAEWR